MPEENENNYTVFIGKKEVGVYIFSIQGQANVHGKVKIKARGSLISKAADISQLALNFLKDWEIKDIKITTEMRPYTQTGEQLGERPKKDERVSVIDIELGKKNGI